MKFDLRSLGVKIWVYFALFSAAILVMIWFLQIVFLNSFYESMKTKTIDAAAAEIAESYGKDDYKKTVDRLAYKNSILIYITKWNGDLVYTSDEHGPGVGRVDPEAMEGSVDLGFGGPRGQRALPRDFDIFLEHLQQNGGEPVSYMINHQESFLGQTLVYGARLQDAVLYISTSLEPLDVTTTILGRQLIYVTIISLLMGFVISFFISKKLARPIEHITETRYQYVKVRIFQIALHKLNTRKYRLCGE